MKPFQANEVTPNETPARTANDIAARFSEATTEKELRIADIFGEVDLVRRSFPECFIALNQNMNPIEINNITNASWSASAQVE